MIDKERLTKTFLDLVRIESPSGKEEAALGFVKKKLEQLAITYHQDKKGNIIAPITGEGEPLLIGSHLDTVGPCANTRPIREKGQFKSDGTTILGADDKAAVAAVLEFLKILRGDKYTHRSLEAVFTVQEELGSKGASALKFSQLEARRGIIFDREGGFGTITSAAPFYYTIDIEMLGKSAHAGLEPEKGISAISLTTTAISGIRQGRIDEETTVNIGTIAGGDARNTVPEKVALKAEVRSLNAEKAKNQADLLTSRFKRAAEQLGGKSLVKINHPCEGFHIEEGDEFVAEVKEGIKNLGFKPRFSPTCGGSDANIFNAHGIETLNLTYGAHNVHTTKEFIALKDLENMVRLLLHLSIT